MAVWIVRSCVKPGISTTRERNGAVAVFYPGVAERIREIIGGDFYVAFTSVDEAKLHRIGTKEPERIAYCVQSVNRDLNAECDVLTNRVYAYRNHQFETVL